MTSETCLHSVSPLLALMSLVTDSPPHSAPTPIQHLEQTLISMTAAESLTAKCMSDTLQIVNRLKIVTKGLAEIKEISRGKDAPVEIHERSFLLVSRMPKTIVRDRGMTLRFRVINKSGEVQAVNRPVECCLHAEEWEEKGGATVFEGSWTTFLDESSEALFQHVSIPTLGYCLKRTKLTLTLTSPKEPTFSALVLGDIAVKPRRGLSIREMGVRWRSGRRE